MAWVPFLLMVLPLFTGRVWSLSQPMLTQPPSATTSLRQIPKLSCTLSSGETGYTVDWNQQSPEKGPWIVMRVGTNSIVGDMGILDRFSGSNSGNTATLTISSTQAEDEADYYCQVWDRGTGR
uniref:Ig-like domain-containing protein n=1 Tax=Castor canadensis TaxID=51338 RepID=A0A8C0XSE4_CASCN